jgi:hypothetical protein
MAKRQTLSSWILEVINEKHDDQQCSAISLVHLVGTQEREVHTMKLGVQDYNAETMAATFQHKAESFAQDLSGVQMFCMLAFYGDNVSEPQARHPLRINGDTGYEGLATEGPHEAGRIQQQMRLTEAIVQGSFRQNSITFDVMLRNMELQQRMIQTYDNQNKQLFDLSRGLLIEKVEQQQKFDLEKLKLEERGKLVDMIPVLANSLLGSEVFTPASADASLIEAIAANITPESLPALQQAIPPKLWPLLADRLLKARKKLEEKQAQGRKLIESGADPAADAAGEVSETPANVNGHN